jgi:hypothetical protein
MRTKEPMPIAEALPDRSPKLDPRLENVDRLAMRWAAGEREHRSLHPLEAIRLLHDGAVLGGGPIPTPDDLVLFDRCLNMCSARERLVIQVWYCTWATAEQKAKQLGVSRATLYNEWKSTLSYFRGWLRGHGLDI